MDWEIKLDEVSSGYALGTSVKEKTYEIMTGVKVSPPMKLCEIILKPEIDVEIVIFGADIFHNKVMKILKDTEGEHQIRKEMIHEMVWKIATKHFLDNCKLDLFVGDVWEAGFNRGLDQKAKEIKHSLNIY